jgi:hypothetical protein
MNDALTQLRLGWERLVGFLFPRESDKWLGALRIGLGLQVVVYSVALKGDWYSLFAGTGSGLVSRELEEAILSFDSPFIPRLGWFVTLASHLNVGEETILSVVWACLFCAGCCLLLGVFSRATAIITWFLHLCVAESTGLLSYGADNFTTIGLFYLMLSPLPDRYSLDQWLGKCELKDPQLLGFWRRVLQLHLCLAYFFGGIAKCLGRGWWDGSNLWQALTRPPFNIINPQILVHGKVIFPVAGIVICLLETSYPFFVWNRVTRKIWLICICAMHVGIGLAMGMYLFALIMIVLNIAAFADVGFFSIARRIRRGQSRVRAIGVRVGLH